MNALRPWALGAWLSGAAGLTVNVLVRRNCYMWRDELVEGVISGFYKPLSWRERMMIHETTGDPKTAVEATTTDRAFGMRATEEFVSAEERDFVLAELQVALDRYGRDLHHRDKAEMHDDLVHAGVDPSFLENVRFISDFYEDERTPKGVWGCGDALNQRQLPPVFRCLAARVKEIAPNIGNLRHVFVIHSANGQLYVPPRFMNDFAGHEYFMLPIAHAEREKLQGGEVITFTPRARSKISDLREVAKSSWTDKDQDLFAPFRSLVRVYATARFRCFYGIRPTKHFGHASNPLPLDNETLESKYPKVAAGAWGSDGASVMTPMEEAGMHVDKIGRSRPWWARLLGLRGPSRDELGMTSHMRELEDRDPEVAIVMLSFEGPVNAEESRNKWRRWEWAAYGRSPRVADFQKMDPEPMISKEEIGDGWMPLFLWIVQNYFKIGRAGELPVYMDTGTNYHNN